MDKALFLTLDNTLIFTKSGQKFPVHSKDWIINIDIFDTVKKYYKEEYKVIIIDNKDSVAHGYVDMKVFDEKLCEILEILERACSLK
jgi:histidinol phosphatase-like enzyme